MLPTGAPVQVSGPVLQGFALPPSLNDEKAIVPTTLETPQDMRVRPLPTLDITVIKPTAIRPIIKPYSSALAPLRDRTNLTIFDNLRDRIIFTEDTTVYECFDVIFSLNVRATYVKRCLIFII